MIVRSYQISSFHIHDDVKIGVITDLHGTIYGLHQQQLIWTIHQQNPDIIFFVGDIVDEHCDMIGIEDLLKGIKQYCCYHVLGNHEFSSNKQDKIISLMKTYGVNVLQQQNEIITIKQTALMIGGIDNLLLIDRETTLEERLENFENRLQQMSQNMNQDIFSLLLSHRPFLFICIRKVVISGHAHGGQWRIPYILNALLALEERLFHRYAGGQYQLNKITLIDSRGLLKN